MSENITLDRANLLLLVRILRESTAHLEMSEAMRAGHNMALEAIEHIAPSMPALYDARGCPDIPTLLDRLEAAEAAIERVRALVLAVERLATFSVSRDFTGQPFEPPVPLVSLRRALEGPPDVQNGAVSAEENAGGSECHRQSSGRENGCEGRSGGMG